MRQRLATSPWYVPGFIYAVFFGAAMTLFELSEQERWESAAFGGAIAGALFGVGMGLFSTRQRRLMLGDLDRFSPTERDTVLRAARRGLVPDDLELRAAARALVQRQLDQTTRMRPWSVAFFAALLVLNVVLAVGQSAWWVLGVLLFAGLIVLLVITPVRLRRRLAAFDAAS